jgi:glycosyltransferase involved in cell wall biosynthesis
MKIKKISIIIPCYNEEKTIDLVLQKVTNYKKYETEIILVNDGSTDNTVRVVNEFKEKSIILINHENNFGKGKAIDTGVKLATGEIVLIQDADLEYSPDDYDILLKPFEEVDADVVYGSRFIGGRGYVRLHYYFHYLANKILTNICNFFTNLNMTDMETGYKVFKREVIKSINLKEHSFGIEPEITIKLAKKKYKFFEVGVSYRGRSYSEGKKITAKDAFVALYCIFKYGFFS